PSCVRVRRSAPNERGGSSLGLEHLVSRRSLPGMLHPWARAGSRRFPGDPSYASALLQDPGRADKASPLAVLPTPPPAYPNRRPQRVLNLEANTGLQHLLSTLHERRRRLPCKTRFRLAGCASTGRTRVCSHLVSSTDWYQKTFASIRRGTIRFSSATGGHQPQWTGRLDHSGMSGSIGWELAFLNAWLCAKQFAFGALVATVAASCVSAGSLPTRRCRRRGSSTIGG